MDTDHQHSTVLRAIAEGKRVQFNTNVGIHGGWVDMSAQSYNNPISRPDWSWRVAAETIPVIQIAETNIPEPLRTELPAGTEYFVVSEGGVDGREWEGSDYDFRVLNAGFAHIERARANLHYAALVVVNTQRGQSTPLVDG